MLGYISIKGTAKVLAIFLLKLFNMEQIQNWKNAANYSNLIQYVALSFNDAHLSVIYVTDGDLSQGKFQ